MSQIGKFIAFEAAIALTHDTGNEEILEEIAKKCKEQEKLPVAQMQNQVKMLYEQFSLKEISCKIAELVRPEDIDWNGKLDVVYQDVEGLNSAMPAYTGDWYFSGEYPTCGGNAVVNRAYVNWYSGDGSKRVY